MPLTINELMDKMPGAFLSDKAGDANVVIQFNFSGDQSSDWYVTIKGGACTVEQGNAENPTMTLAAEGKDYIDIVTGVLDPMKAFMEGKVKLSGDLGLAMKMTSFFKLD